jgi:predicted P-loop ATPase
MRAPKANGGPVVVADPNTWQAHLLRSDKGEPRALLANALVALEHAPAWRGVLAHDAFADRVILAKAPPFHTCAFAAREIRDTDFTWTAQWLQTNGIAVSADIAMAAMVAIAHRQSVHPVRDYLNGLEWDGEPRLDTWLVDHLGAEDTELNRLCASKFLLSAAARVFSPGCKVDTLLILEGRQGLKKSSALRALAGDWFTDHMPDLSSKDAPMQIQGIWILEFAEFDKLGKTEASRAKSFISAQADRFRRPYGRATEDFPRQTVFAATINPGGAGYLQDETGNRRYWTVACGANWEVGRQVDVKGLLAVRDQLWAEAVTRFAAGEAWWLESVEDENAQAEEAAARLVEDVWASGIADYVVSEDDTSVPEVLAYCVGKPADTWTQADQNRVARVLTSLGWERKSVRKGSGRDYRYFRTGKAAPKVIDKDKEKAKADKARAEAAKVALEKRMEREASEAGRAAASKAAGEAADIRRRLAYQEINVAERERVIRERFALLASSRPSASADMLEAAHPDLDDISPIAYGTQNGAACKIVLRWLSDTLAH